MVERTRVREAWEIEEVVQPRIPRATYRLQFGPAFTFHDAAVLVPYLDELGISDCYASPILKARPGGHGYDICDPTQLNPELGGEEGFAEFAEARESYEMGLILDMVPNHMGIGSCNEWWLDVQENGPSSVYAPYFDIHWHPIKPELENKVLLPILGEQYGRVLESGQLRLEYEEGAFYIKYWEHLLPVAPRTYTLILSKVLDKLLEELSPSDEHLLELQSILTALSYLPTRTETDPKKIAERVREKEIVKRRIMTLTASSPPVAACIERVVERFNGTSGDPRSFDLLDALIHEQPYRLAFWRVAAEEINYRRFFDINDLAAIRVELQEVFDATHDLTLRLLREGKASGLRIDHPDGLWDPCGYFRQLQAEHVRRCLAEAPVAEMAISGVGSLGVNGAASESAANDPIYARISEMIQGQMGEAAPHWPLYLVVEKILAEGEYLPQDWAVYGTTGYDFLNAINGLFVDSRHERAFDRLYGEFLGRPIHFTPLVDSAKKMIMRVALASELNTLAYQLERLAERNRNYRDFTLMGLTMAVREVIAGLEVYRTYIDPTSGVVSDRDRTYIKAAVRRAKQQNTAVSESVFDFIGDTLLLRTMDEFGEEDRPAVVNFIMKFQQLTGPIMAKGVEDTAFYIYNRLVSLNEVGGHPDRFGVAPADAHEANEHRRRYWPHSMLTTSTHDTKRSEDVRARINVLSELPEEWRASVRRWSRLNERHKVIVEGEPAPSRNDEYLLYQTLVGAWPITSSEEDLLSHEELVEFRDRIVAYMDKATNEAKVYTSWINPNAAYDQAVREFTTRVLANQQSAFFRSFLPFQRRIARYGAINSLAQTLLKLTSPGVPDIYQGTELWDLSLVDPDNRRPIDYGRRRRLLDDLKSRAEAAEAAGGQDGGLAALARELGVTWRDGRIKLYLIFRTLNFRREHEALFTHGDYHALEARGAKAHHLFAFARASRDQGIIVAVPRLVAGLTEQRDESPTATEVWGDTWLRAPSEEAGSRYRNIFTGDVQTVEDRDGAPGLALGEILAHFPVALLQRLP